MLKCSALFFALLIFCTHTREWINTQLKCDGKKIKKSIWTNCLFFSVWQAQVCVVSRPILICIYWNYLPGTYFWEIDTKGWWNGSFGAKYLSTQLDVYSSSCLKGSKPESCISPEPESVAGLPGAESDDRDKALDAGVQQVNAAETQQFVFFVLFE